MLFDGIKLVEGSEINNLVVQTGVAWPTSPSEGELFYMREGGIDTEGLYVYDGVAWLMTNNEFLSGDIIAALGYTPANKAGDTFTGPVVLSGAPSTSLEAATKGYVDSTVGAVGSGAQPLDADLTAIAGLNGTGILRRTGVEAWTLDTSNYLTGNQNISVTGDATGSGTTSISLSLAASGVAAGSYGTASSVGTVNVDAKGRIVSASNTPIAIDASQVTSGTFNSSRISQASVTQYQSALTISESQITDGAILARNAGNESITGTWAFSVAPTAPMPTAGGQVANKDYVDNIAAGVSPQRSAKVTTTANITLSGLQTIDGYAVQAGERVLVKDQSTGSQNGVYDAAAGAWTRASDFDGSPVNEVSSGALVYVEQGDTNGNSSWVLVTADPITIGTTALSFSIFSRPGDLVAGAGLTKTGNQFDVGTASSSRIVVNVDNIDLAAVGTAGTYTSVTTDAYGRVTAGANPTTIAGYGITDAITTSGGSITGSLSVSGSVTAGSFSGAGTGLTGTAANLTSGASLNAIAFGGYTADLQTTTSAGDYVLVRNQTTTKIQLATAASLASMVQGSATGTWAISISGSAANVSGTVAVANGGTGATTAEGATTSIGASRINPTNPKDGDIRITAGPVISIYATGAWRQVFPAVYS